MKADNHSLILLRKCVALAIILHLFNIILKFDGNFIDLFLHEYAPNNAPTTQDHAYLIVCLFISIITSAILVLFDKWIKYTLPALFLSFSFLWRSNPNMSWGWGTITPAILLCLIFCQTQKRKHVNFLPVIILQSFLIQNYIGASLYRFFESNWFKLDALLDILNSVQFSRFPLIPWEWISLPLKGATFVFWAAEFLAIFYFYLSF